MRTKLVTIALAGALAVGGAAVTGTALAATDDGATPTPTPSAPSGAPQGARPTAPDDATARADRIKKALAGLVADKTLTQEQADKVASTLAASGAGRGPGGPRGFGPKMGGGLTTAAKALGMSETDLMTALRSGKSLAAVAKDKGVAVQKVVDALVAEAKQRMADAVADGRLTQAQADQRLKDLTTRITERVNSTRPARPGGMGHGFGHGGFGPGGSGAPGTPGPDA